MLELSSFSLILRRFGRGDGGSFRRPRLGTSQRSKIELDRAKIKDQPLSHADRFRRLYASR